MVSVAIEAATAAALILAPEFVARLLLVPNFPALASL